MIKPTKHYRKGAIPLCLIERNHLATRYLQVLLGRVDEVHVLRNIGVLARQRLQTQPFLSVIDTDSVSIPVPRYVQSLHTALPQSKILLLGNPLSTKELCVLLFAGIHGFLTYDDVESKLIAAIHRIWEGHLSIAVEVLEEFRNYASRLSRLAQGQTGTFTPQQKQIINLTLQKLANKEIGYELRISERTVKFHLRNIFVKLGVRDRQSLVQLAQSGELPESLWLATGKDTETAGNWLAACTRTAIQSR